MANKPVNRVMSLEYKDYYLRTIYNNQNGLKLVLGGTGLGKTHGMREAVKEYLQSDIEEKRKIIYITNRHNLIREQQEKFEADGFKCCYLKGNPDIILELINDNSLPDLLNELENLNYFRYDDQLKSKYKRELKFKKLIEEIKQKRDLVAERGTKAALRITIKAEIISDCNEIFKILKDQLINAGRNDKEFYNDLLKEECVWKFFPYVEFENNPDANILITTIAKVLHGFFDGRKDIKIASISDKIIFLDEFDYLEQEILKILCKEPSTNNPLEFVRIFYLKFNHWAKAPFWDSREDLQKIKELFLGVIKYIDDACAQKKINFLNVLDWRIENIDEETSNSFTLFKTNNIVTSKPFFLKEQNNSFYIVDKKSNDTMSPYQLFDILVIATHKILGVFHYMQTHKDPAFILEVIQNIWNEKNDNTGGRYENYILENCLYHRTKPNKEKQDIELFKHKSPYEIGYRLIKLAKRTASPDPNSAELGQIELFTSPESLIAKLSDSNTIFGLSATADIPRTLRCFNLEWLEKNATFIPLEPQDYAIIEARRDFKKEKRQTKVNLRIAETLPESHPLSLVCQALGKTDFFSEANDFEGSSIQRYNRVMRIFDSIDKCCKGKRFSHLIFVESFKHIKKILDYSNSPEGINPYLFTDCTAVFTSKRVYDTSFNENYFQVTLNGNSCMVLLLDSDEAKRLQGTKKAREAYQKCFVGQDRVIVITQYNSASNGVNLYCYPNFIVNDANGNPVEADFEGVHLLDQRYFWFDNESDEKDFKTNEKQAYWYWWKLFDRGQIDSTDFKIALTTQKNKNSYKLDIGRLNKFYKENADEKILNSIALFHQALGRIERRDNCVPEVDVTLERSVFNDFYDFLSQENLKEIADRRENITSGLILNIQQAVLEKARQMNIISELHAQKPIDKKNERSKETISELLSELEKVRKGEYDTETSNEIKVAWTDLRQALLKHEFKGRFNIESLGRSFTINRDFAFETKYINKAKDIFIHPEKLKIYRDNLPGKKLSIWNLDSPYRYISQNTLLKRLFSEKGYKTEFEIKPNLVNFVLTPYINQAILLGAIGEEAISLLLSYNGVELEVPHELDNDLFEVIDSKTKIADIYFDFKNYSSNTLDKFSLKPTDRNYNNELSASEFRNKLKEKYSLLKTKNENPILYVLNLHSNESRTPDYFDCNMEQVEYEKDSCIRVIPSVLNPKNVNELSSDFLAALKFINQHETASL